MPGPVSTQLATTQPDVVEVLRGTAASDAAVAATYAGTVAAAAVIVAVVALVRRSNAAAGDSRVLSTNGSAPTGAVTGVMLAAAAVALLATTIELAFLLIDGAGLDERRPLVALARLLATVGVIAGQRLGDTDPLAGPVRWTVAGVGVMTVPVGIPALGGLATLAIASAATLIAIVLAWVGLALGARVRPQFAPALSLLVVVALGVPAGLALAPEQTPPYHQQRLIADDVALDITVAPVAAGTNELHLYAWEADGQELAVEQATVEVVGHEDTRHQLLRISPNHHLSYALELPPAERWELVLDCLTADGRELTTTMSLEAP